MPNKLVSYYTLLFIIIHRACAVHEMCSKSNIIDAKCVRERKQ